MLEGDPSGIEAPLQSLYYYSVGYYLVQSTLEQNFPRKVLLLPLHYNDHHIPLSSLNFAIDPLRPGLFMYMGILLMGSLITSSAVSFRYSQ